MSEEQEQAIEAYSSEQRSTQRFRINMSVQIRLSGGSMVCAQGKNISGGGLYIEFEAPADLGDEFGLMFDLPFTDEIKRVYVKGRVMRSALIGDKDVYGIGFQFIDFAKGTGAVLEKYIDLRGMKQGGGSF